MPTISQKISPCLWFADEAEDAAKLYTSIFPDSKIVHIERYPNVGQEIHGRPAGSVMTVAFRLAGQDFTALNGGPIFKFSAAISLQVFCEDQAEVDRYWNALGEGGPVEAQQCGWLKDRFGLSWQVIPKMLIDLIADPDRAKAQRVFSAMLQMKKLDVAALKTAAGIN